ncbi:MFS transporter [Chloroflexota bacterium]
MTLLSSIKDRLFYGWVVVIACLFIATIIYGARYSFGVFFKSIESEFDLTRAATSGVFSIYMVFCSAIAVLGGWALDRYGPRIITFLMGIFTGLSLILTGQASSPWQLFISYSLLLAIGTGAGYTVLMATASRWFDKKRGLAMGIAGSGAGLGTVVMAPFAAYLISAFDWRMAFVVIGLISGLVIISLSMLLKKSPGEIGLSLDGVKSDSGEIVVQDRKDDAQPGSFSLIQAFRTRSFWFFWVMWLSFSASLHLIITHLVPHATDVGISGAEAAIFLGLVGAMSIPGRLIVGGVSDRIGRKVSAVTCAIVQAGAMMCLTWSQEPWMFYLFAVVYGFAYGGFDAPTAALIGDIFGLRSLGVIMGVLVVGWGIGAAIGPAVGGFIYDVRESYFAAFLIGALSMLAAALLVSLTKRETSRNI